MVRRRCYVTEVGRIAACALFFLLLVLGTGLVLFGQATITGPSQMEQCDNQPFTISFTNDSPTQTACHIVVTNTLPSGYYQYVTGSGHLTLPGGVTYSADPSGGSWDVNVIAGAFELAPGATLSVQFRLSTACGAVSGTDSARVDYVDCTNLLVPLQRTDSTSIEILPGAITITKTPEVIPAGFGDVVIWTLTVNSTGLGSIKNVVAWDVLGPGLTYVSSSPAGSVAGQTITWDSSAIPALSAMAPGASVSITLRAKVTSCSGLGNKLDARFGCATGEECDNTVSDPNGCGCSTATAAVQFVQRLPFLSFTAPTITILYCSSSTTVSFPIQNSGDGTALEGTLCANFGPSLVISNVQGGATYDGLCFHLPDIAAHSTFTLAFDVGFGGTWCTTSPSGTPLYTLDYQDDCGIQYHASPGFGPIGASATPALSVSKTGPAIADFGSAVTYQVTATYSGPTSCGSGTTTPVTVTDFIPDGFPVLDAGGGTWAPGSGGTGGTITWTFDPASAFSKSVTVQIPLNCGYCYTTPQNTVTAQATSCCGCPLSASSSVTTAITCEQLYTSALTFSPSSVLERCGDPVTFTDAHQFDDNPALDPITFSDFTYYTIKANGLSYVAGSASATIDGTPTPVTVIDSPTSPTVQFIVSDPRSVRSHSLTYTFQMQATSTSSPVCGGSSTFLVWEYHELGSIGDCTQRYDTAFLTVEAPGMSVGISGVPTIQEDCATYPVTITLHRASTTAHPYDARLVLTWTAGLLANFAGATWGGVTPVEAPIIGTNSVEWRFADGFAALGASATLTVPVTVPCGGDLMNLAAQAFFDDRCSNIAGYNNTCSTSASASSSLRLTGDLHITKTPEVVYTTVRSVTWQVEVSNSSNGSAYNAYVDDVLGSGLVYASSSVSSSVPAHNGVLPHANQDHNGGAINGASFLFDQIAPGERVVITFTANLVACQNMSNDATVGWGCGGAACQVRGPAHSGVLVPPASEVATSSFTPSTLDACQPGKATLTVKSTNVASTYNTSASATLPAGLLYLGNSEYQVNGIGGWLPAGDPSGAPGPGLTWTESQVPALAVMAPGTTVRIRFDASANCGFSGGSLTARTTYQNPCGQTFTSAIGSFAITTRTPTLSVVTTQVAPAAGQPIPCGGDVTREIRVTNSGPAAAAAVWVEDTLGAGFTYASSTGGADGGSNSGQVTTWEISNLAAGATATLTIVAHSTSGPGNCGALTSAVKAYWGCEPDGNSSTPPNCLSATFATASYSGTRRPTVSATAALSPSSIGACAQGTTFTLTLTNSSTSAPAYSPDAKVTLPTGLSYRTGTTEVNCGTGFSPAADPLQAGQALTWYNTGATGPGNDLCSSIPAGGSVAVRFQVDASCFRTTGSAAIDLYYYDCCGTTQHHVTSSKSIAAAAPSLSVTMTPASTSLDCGNPANFVTWTITVTNQGQVEAAFVRIEDTLGVDLVHVSGGTMLGGDPQKWGFEFGPLGAGASQSVQVTARFIAPPNDCAVSRRRNTAVATWGCIASPLDNNPNTTGEYACQSGSPVTTTADIVIPDLAVANLAAPCGLDDTFNVSATVRNLGTQAATGASIRVYADGTLIHSETQSIAVSGSYALVYRTPPLNCGVSHMIRIVSDEQNTICECSEANNEASTAAQCPCPALTTQKSITNVWRKGASVWPTAAVEAGDVIEYQVVIANNSAAIAFQVNLTDSLPAGLKYGTAAPGHGGTYALSGGGGSGTFPVSAGGSTFTTTLNATLGVGQSLTTSYCAVAQSSMEQGAILTNVVQGHGQEGNGLPIPAGSSSATTQAVRPGFEIEKAVTGIWRNGSSIGSSGPVEPGDVLLYRVTITNVGGGTAYEVDLTDVLPAGLQYETAAPGIVGTYVVSAPHATGSYTVPQGGTSFQAAIHAQIAGGGTLTTTYGARATSAITQTTALVNTATVTGKDGAGTAIPEQDSSISDAFLDHAPAAIGAAKPGLALTKALVDVRRGGTSVGTAGPILYDDIVVYEVAIRNVGLGTAYQVELTDALPAGLLHSTATSVGSGTYQVSLPSQAGSLGVVNGATNFTTAIHATIASGGTLTATYAAHVTTAALPGADLVNTAQTTGKDGAGTAIPEFDSDVGDTFPDSATAKIRIGVPALVTSKAVSEILRAGESLAPGQGVEPGDLVIFTLGVTNVGQAPALHVTVTDNLPVEFVYVPGTTQAGWPSGSSADDPAGGGVPGVLLQFALNAYLGAGESLTLAFQVRATDAVRDRVTYLNTMHATGKDVAGNAIPADQSRPVPADTDRDDSSLATLVGRKAESPTLTKEATVLGAGSCEGSGTWTDRVWFQTDIAMFASAELEELWRLPGGTAISPATLLPTWQRTLVSAADEVGRQNLAQVSASSRIGLDLELAPRIQALAAAQGISAQAALEAVLSHCAQVAGLGLQDRVENLKNERWVFIEYAGGDPRLAQRDDTLWPGGSWLVYDQTIVPSALGMSLVKEASEASRLLRSDLPLDRYQGLVQSDAMAEKVALLADHVAQSADGTPYIAHSYAAAVASGSPLRLEVADRSSHLFDQLSLVWGLSEFIALEGEARAGRFASEPPFATTYVDLARGLAQQAVAAIRVLHRSSTGALIEEWSPNGGTSQSAGPATTADLGLLLVALARAGDVLGDAFHAGASDLLREQSEALLGRQLSDGTFPEQATAETGSLDAQFGAIRGLLVARGATSDDRFLAAAQRTFDALETSHWDEATSLYIPLAGGAVLRCYTPFDLGLVAGALRELALATSAERGEPARERLGRFFHALAEEAGLELSYAAPSWSFPVYRTADTDDIRPFVLPSAPLKAAPVLQQRLCLQTESLGACPGWQSGPQEPWYQTDVAMYASSMVEAFSPWAEDYADANLVGLLFHSTMGISLGPNPRSIAATQAPAPRAPLDERLAAWARLAGLDRPVALTPIFLEYASGSPRLETPGSLAWNPATFDRAITGSSLGMTLLREATEARELLVERRGTLVGKSASEGYTGLVLAGSIADKLLFLANLAESTAKGTGVAYVPHAVSVTEREGRLDWTTTDASSELFDQIALLWGLSATYALVTDAHAADLFRSDGPLGDLRPDLVVSLVRTVLSTLRGGHQTPDGRILVDRATHTEKGWACGMSVTTANLGLAIDALSAASDALSDQPELALEARGLARSLLSFLRDAFVDERIGLRGRYVSGGAQDDACGPVDLASRLATIRAFVVGTSLFPSADYAALAGRAFDGLDAFLFDKSLGFYVNDPNVVSPRYTPLELGLATSALEGLARASTPVRAALIRERLLAFFHGVADMAGLQLETFTGMAEPRVEHFAPVFAREVVLNRHGGQGESRAAALGDLVRYDLALANPTGKTLTDLVLEDSLPAGLTYVSSTPAGAIDGSTLRFTAARLCPGESRTWSVLARVDKPGDLSTNCARLTYTDPATGKRAVLETCATKARAAAGLTAGKGPSEITDALRRGNGALFLSVILASIGLGIPGAAGFKRRPRALRARSGARKPGRR